MRLGNRTIGVNLVPYMLVGGVFDADNKSGGQVVPSHNVGTNTTRVFGALSAHCCLNQDFQDYQIFRIIAFGHLLQQ